MKQVLLTIIFLFAGVTTAIAVDEIPSPSPIPDETPMPELCPDDQIVTFDFEVDSDGVALPAGTIVTNQFAGDFLSVSASNSTNSAIIFDSANPTGGDTDLGTPNIDFGGPGSGAGGKSGQPGENSLSHGKVLILAEDVVDVIPAGGDGLVDDPDDDAGGGTMFFDFAFPVRVLGIEFLDIELPEGVEITGKNIADGVEFVANASSLGDNSYQFVDLNPLQSGFPVAKLEVKYDRTSGAVGSVSVCEQERDCLDIPGGTAVLDDCGVCDGNNEDKDACGVCFGDIVDPDECVITRCDEPIDDCGVCGGNNEAIDDCGVCFGENADKDDCDVCFGDGLSCISCDEVNIASTQFALDGVAADQARLVRRAVQRYRKVSGKRKAFKSTVEQADILYMENWAATWSLPTIVQFNCSNQILCLSADNSVQLFEYEQNADELFGLTKKVVKKTNKVTGGVTKKSKRMMKRARSLVAEEQELLATVPPISQDCSAVS